MTSKQRYFRMNPLSRFNLFQRLILAVGSGFMIAILLIIALSVLFSCAPVKHNPRYRQAKPIYMD